MAAIVPSAGRSVTHKNTNRAVSRIGMAVVGVLVAVLATASLASWFTALHVKADSQAALETKVLLAGGITPDQEKVLEAKIGAVDGVSGVTAGKGTLAVHLSDPQAATAVKKAIAGDPAVSGGATTPNMTRPAHQLAAALRSFRLLLPIVALLLVVGGSASLSLIDLELRRRLAEPRMRVAMARAGRWREHWVPRYIRNLGGYAWRWQKQRVSAWMLTVVVMGVVLSMASAAQLLVWLGGKGISSQLHAASEMQVFLSDGASAEQQSALKAKLAAIPGVNDVSFRSKAAAEAVAAHDPQLATLAGAAEGNPFPASFLVRMSDPVIAKKVLKTVTGDPAVDSQIPASYTAAQAQRLSTALGAIQVVAWVVDALALGVGALVALALLRSEIRARREELRMLSLVGVPTVVVRLPLLIQVLSIGIAGSLLAILSLSYVGSHVVPALDHSLPFLHLGDPSMAVAALSTGTLAVSCLALIPCALLVRLPR